MYRPGHFDIGEVATLHALLAAAGAVHLVTSDAAGDGALDASLIPMLFDPAAGEHGALLGHVSRANPQWKLGDGTPVLAIVPSADAYISPNWMQTKRDTGKVVPTWNYTVIHVHGALVVHDDAAWLDSLVRALTDRHEAGTPSPWSVDDAPADYISATLRGIVGVEVRIARIEGKAKLSQNRSPGDVDGIIAGLAAGDAASQRVADDMRRAREGRP